MSVLEGLVVSLRGRWKWPRIMSIGALLYYIIGPLSSATIVTAYLVVHILYVTFHCFKNYGHEGV